MSRATPLASRAPSRASRHRSRWSVAMTSAVGLALALALGTPGPGRAADASLPAPSSTGSSSAPADSTAPVEAAQTLAEATAALGAPSSDRAEATLALRDLFLARPALDEGGTAAADDLLARPTDGARDPYGDGYASKAARTCSANVCVHYVRTGADAPPNRAWATTTRSMMEKVWRHHTRTLGYREPATDGRRGGNAKFDVYLKDLGSRGLYGYCAPERRVPGERKQASGFCVLDDDFSAAQYGRAPVESLRVTAAHEFFHAIQFAYDFTEDHWLFESTATWIEERFADAVNDNRSYLRYGQAQEAAIPLDLFDAAGLAHYGNWVFWEFLTERLGNEVVRDTIRRTGTGGGLPDDYSTQAVRAVLRDRGGLTQWYAAFASANTLPSRSYAEGAAFPGVAPVQDVRVSPARPRLRLETRVDHLAAKTIRITPASLRSKQWRLAISARAPGVGSPALSVLAIRKDGTLQRRTLPLGKRGFVRTRIPFSGRQVAAVHVTLANASTRYACGSGSAFACGGRPLDQRERFEVTARAYRR